MGAGNKKNNDGRYSTKDVLLKRSVKKISKKGHVCGFHPGYYTYNNEILWKEEKEELERNAKIKVEIGRQHYLRLKVPNTWRIWEKNGMKEDQSLGYHDLEGFRAGTGDTFTVFDCLQRRPLKLKETPLVVMDNTLYSNKNRGYSVEEARESVNRIIYKAKKYKMKVVFLFHNNFFYKKSKAWKELYLHVLRSYTKCD
jgi:hypothetical protein